MWDTFCVIFKISLGIMLAMWFPLIAFTIGVIAIAYYYGGFVATCLSPALFLVVLYIYIYHFCHKEKRKKNKKRRRSKR